MLENQTLESFWSSLVTQKGLTQHAERLMSVSDIEERAFSLLSRVSFLWGIGFKGERDTLSTLVEKISDIVGENPFRSCSNCANIKLLIQKSKNGCKNSDKCPSNSDNTSSSWNSQMKGNSKMPKRLLTPPSPEKKKRQCMGNKENYERSSTQHKLGKILAPETQYEVEQCTLTEPQCGTKIIPETVDLNMGQYYGNTDVFDIENNSGSPDNSPPLNVDKGSPILGKQSKTIKMTEPIKSQKALHQWNSSVSEHLKTISPSRVGSGAFSPTKEPQQIFTPESANNSLSLLGFQEPPSSNHILKRSDAKPSHDDTPEDCSNSLESEANTSKTAITVNLSSSPETVSPLQSNKTLRVSPRKLLFSKPQSTLSAASNKQSKLSRRNTVNSVKSSKLGLQIEIDHTVKPKKNYRQTKITPESFFKKANLKNKSGGKPTPQKKLKEVKGKEDLILKEVVERSLHSKEAEDLIRQNSQKPLTKLKRVSPLKKTEEELEEAVSQVVSECLMKSSQKPPSNAVTPLGGEQSHPPQLEKGEGSRGRRIGGKLARNKSRHIYEDSFDMLPEREEDPGYAYQGDVVRKRSERNRLEGWECHDCRDYFQARGGTEAQRKEIMNKCSRHRSKHPTVTNTPEGFWVVGWGDESSPGKG